MNKKENINFELTNLEKDWFHSQGMREEFSHSLKQRLTAYHKVMLLQNAAKKEKNIWKKVNWLLAGRSLSSRIAGITISILLVLIFVSGVVYAVNKLTGYIPGFGIINQETQLRVLSSVQKQTMDGIQLKVVSAISGMEVTSVVYSLKGIPPDTFAGNAPLTPNNQRCEDRVWLQLPDGQKLSPLGSGSLGYGKENDYQKVVFFPPIPNDMNSLTFKLDCIDGTYPGDAPENWAVPFSLVESANDIGIYPILKIKANQESEIKNAIIVSELIPLEDKIIVLGRYIPEFIGVFPIQLWDVSFMDAGGNHLPYDVSGDIQLFDEDADGRFAYVVSATPNHFPLEMKIDKIQYGCPGDAIFRMKLKDYPPDNQERQVGKILNLGNCQIKLVSVINNGKQLAIKFKSVDHSFYQVNVQEANNPARFVSSRILGDTAIVKVNASTLMDAKKTDVRIGGVVLEPRGPLSVRIDIEAEE